MTVRRAAAAPEDAADGATGAAAGGGAETPPMRMGAALLLVPVDVRGEGAELTRGRGSPAIKLGFGAGASSRSDSRTAAARRAMSASPKVAVAGPDARGADGPGGRSRGMPNCVVWFGAGPSRCPQCTQWTEPAGESP